MKTLKNRWETELDNAVPALSEELKNAPIVKAECVETRENTKQTVWASLVGFFARIYRKLRTDKKWFSACLTAGVACLLTVCIVLPLAVGGIDKPVASGTADVVAVDVDESLVDEAGKLHLDRAHLAAFAHGEYFELGKKIGTFGFSMKKKKKDARGAKKR